jgi:hypothetical protein
VAVAFGSILILINLGSAMRQELFSQKVCIVRNNPLPFSLEILLFLEIFCQCISFFLDFVSFSSC